MSASIKVLNGTYGFTTIIYDTSLYNWIRQYGSPVNLVNNGTITEYGSALKTIISSYANQIRLSGGHNLTAGEYSFANVIAWMQVIFPNFYVWEMFVRENIDAKYNESSEYSYVRLKHDGPYGSITNTFSTDGSSFYGLGWEGEHFPYASMRGDASEKIRFTIAVFDDDGTNLTTLYIDSTWTGITARYVNIDSTRADLLKAWIAGIPAWSDTDDPFKPGGNTDPSPKPPTGDFDNTSDPIDVSTLPTLSAVDTRFISLFKPDLTQLQSLATYMWGANFDLETFKKLFNDPMAAILGLSIVPVDPPAAAAAPITLGNITTTISMPKITSQYVQVPCGTLNVNEYWGAYLDYSPFTKLEIYLPYIGVQTLDADDIMGRSVEVVYNIDVLSGACVAQLKCGDSVLYSFAGSCAVSIPITGRDWTNMINGIIGVATAAAGIAVAGATGGASVAAAAAGGALSQTANSLSSMKPTVQKSGTMAAGSGMLAIQKPYLILTRPRQALPENQNKYTGYPSFITATLGDLTGMTYVYEIHLENVDCTQAEQAEIETLLKNGVIL